MFYISPDSLGLLFSYLQTRYARVEEVPQYRGEVRFQEFLAVLERVTSDYYPTLLDKAVFLLVTINKSHFFSNGNKRLALVMMTFFLGINDVELDTSISKNSYQEILQNLFPEFERFEDFEDFTSVDYATYNLSILIADSGVYSISHDSLKERILSFLNQTTIEMK